MSMPSIGRPIEPMVNGSSRGDISTPTIPTLNDDPYNKLAWVNKTFVNIGTDDETKTIATPQITGNVYGGGEKVISMTPLPPRGP